MLSDVAASVIAISSGVSPSPASLNSPAATAASASVSAKPRSAWRSTVPRIALRRISRPARKSRSASPTCANTAIGSPIEISFSPCGPIAIPARISSTMPGIRSAGKSPSSSGAQNATTVTTTKPV